MRRTLTFTLLIIVAGSFLGQFPVTASAPTEADFVNPMLFTQADAAASGSWSGTRRETFPAPFKYQVLPNEVTVPATFVNVVDTEQPILAAAPAIASDSEIAAARIAQTGSFCDTSFVGDAMTFTRTTETTLDDLLTQIHNRFGINFVAGPHVGGLRINAKTDNVPWTTLLRSQLFVLGVGYECVDGNTIRLIKNDDVDDLQRAADDATVMQTNYIKLKYIQPSSSGNRNVAGQSSGVGGGGANGASGGCQQTQGQGGNGGAGGQSALPQRCKFERLIMEIRQILGLNDNGQFRGSESFDNASLNGGRALAINNSAYRITRKPYVGQVPGRNMLVIRANSLQLAEINELIRRADVPPYQVVIKGLVYTANEDRLRDIGVQTNLLITNKNGTMGSFFGHTSEPTGSLFDFRTIIGTAAFNVQANALQQNGVITIKARPFSTVLDGDTTDLTVGRQVPVIIQAITPIEGATAGNLQILQAANLLSVTPHVIDDDNGNPTAVNLEMQLESNDVDTSVISQGVPSVSVRSIQSNIILNQEQTAILGGFTVDADNRSISKTPGLAEVPILGELFKRRIRSSQVNRLYFAISVTVVPYGGEIEPVEVPGASTAPEPIPPGISDKDPQKGTVPKKSNTAKNTTVSSSDH